MHVEEGDITLDLRGTERMRAATVFVQMSSSAAKHALMQVGAPLLSVSILLAPLALRGEFLVGPVPWTVNCLDHSRDVVR